MKITRTPIKLKDLVNGFVDDENTGCRAYGGKLDIRPPYQREFCYSEEKQRKVIETVLNGLPLNVVYWSQNDNGSFEVIDGQQRIMSICRYFTGNFNVQINNGIGSGGGNEFSFINLKGSYPSIAQKIEDYELDVYICEGTTKEKLDWFETINISGEKLNKQELRNATYVGPWLTDARRYFAKADGQGVRLCQGTQKYVSGTANRQEILETAIEWAATDAYKNLETRPKDPIAKYMADHQKFPDALELKTHFNKVITWVKNNFSVYRKEMASQDWGDLYSRFSSTTFNAAELEGVIGPLFADEDVQKKSGIYEYALELKTPGVTAQEKHLSIRAFKLRDAKTKYEQQTDAANKNGHSNCPCCANSNDEIVRRRIYAFEEMEADHIIPWSRGGHTDFDNLQMLCQKCNREKGGR